MTLIALRMLLGGWLSKLLAFVRSLSFWQLAFGAALIFAGIQTIRVKAEQRHASKVEAQLIKATAELKRISTARNVQKQTTDQNVKTVVRVIHDADQRARVVEAAPPAKDCKTKPEIMGADL